ncbi:MAG TPA: hypothetical protein VGH17_05910 [Candidatus Acidoferrales bacterium]|jgi:hypothetical protein
MARQQAAFQNRKLIVGAALMGLGLLILSRNVSEAPVLIRFLRIMGEQADSLGVLSAGSMALRHFLQAYLFNHAEFLQVLYQILLSFLGVLLIVMGAILAAVFATGREGLKKKTNACRFRCLSFDV